MILQHLDRREQRRRRDFARAHVGGDHCLGRRRILADNGGGVLLAEGPTAFAGLAA